VITATIVIPVFNRAHLVRKAIDSALAQTIPCEVVLVDHGSSDGIAGVVADYGVKVRYIRRDVDSGPVVSWRDGVAHARGEYVHITYDDDWIEPDFMERCLAEFNSEVGFVYTRATIHQLGGGPTRLALRHPPGRREVSQIARYLLRTPLTISPGCAVFRTSDARKNLIESVPGASGRYGAGTGVGEDLLLFLLTTLDYGQYVHLAAPLAHFLSHPRSITIGAIRGGRSSELAQAYDVARRFYLAQSGAVGRPSHLVRSIDALRWRTAGILEAPW
jgi:glycosyltransferase involved in cell wall biosynthesis